MDNKNEYSPMGIVEDEKEAEEYKRQLANMGTGDEKEYLILFAAYVNDSSYIQYKEWEYVKGRQNAYDCIKDYFLNFKEDEKGFTLQFDAFESRIIVQSSSGVVPIKGISVYKFIKTMVMKDLVIPDSSFDIEEWEPDSDNEKEYQEEE